MFSLNLGPIVLLLYIHYLVTENFLCAANLQPQNTIFFGHGKDRIKRSRLESNCSRNELPLSPCFKAIIKRRTSGTFVRKRLTRIKIPKEVGSHFAVIENNLYYISSTGQKFGRACSNAYRFVPPSRDRRWLLQISRILKNHDVPDFEFTFFMNDVPPTRVFTFLPAFSFSRLKKSDVIPFPFLKSDFSKNLALPAKDIVYEQLKMESELLKFHDRKDQLIWVGSVKNTDVRVSKTSARTLIKDMQKKFPNDIYVPDEKLSFIRQETEAEQWYQADLVPYIHFIPIKKRPF